jgi:hypothetical protein
MAEAGTSLAIRTAVAKIDAHHALGVADGPGHVEIGAGEGAVGSVQRPSLATMC